jgi:hypothetical protein
MTEEHPKEENDWTRVKYGEHGKDKSKHSSQRETWRETYKEDGDYWERKSEKITFLFKDGSFQEESKQKVEKDVV